MDVQQIPQLVADLRAIVYGDAPLPIHIDPHQPSGMHLQAFHQNQFHPLGGEQRFRELRASLHPDAFRARKLPTVMVRFAEEQFKVVGEAYDLLKR